MATAALLSPIYMSVLLLRPSILEYFQSASTLIYIAARTPQIIQNYNNSIHSSTGYTPNKAINNVSTIKNRLKNAAWEKITHEPSYPPLIISDFVRISLQSTVDYWKQTFRMKYLS